MLYGLEQHLRVRHLLEVAVEVPVTRKALPEFAASMPRFERGRTHPQQLLRSGVEVRKHAVTIEKEVRLTNHV